MTQMYVVCHIDSLILPECLPKQAKYAKKDKTGKTGKFDKQSLHTGHVTLSNLSEMFKCGEKSKNTQTIPTPHTQKF